MEKNFAAKTARKNAGKHRYRSAFCGILKEDVMKKTLAIIFVLFTGLVFAEDPVLNVQGVLRDADGAAVPDGENYQLTFYIYDTEFGVKVIQGYPLSMACIPWPWAKCHRWADWHLMCPIILELRSTAAPNPRPGFH